MSQAFCIFLQLFRFNVKIEEQEIGEVWKLIYCDNTEMTLIKGNY